MEQENAIIVVFRCPYGWIYASVPNATSSSQTLNEKFRISSSVYQLRFTAGFHGAARNVYKLSVS